jgi:hypothetical protein
MVLRGQTIRREGRSDVKNGISYLIRNTIGIKVPPAERRIPVGTSQVNTCTSSGSILKIKGAEVLSHPVRYFESQVQSIDATMQTHQQCPYKHRFRGLSTSGHIVLSALSWGGPIKRNT